MVNIYLEYGNTKADSLLNIGNNARLLYVQRSMVKFRDKHSNINNS